MAINLRVNQKFFKSIVTVKGSFSWTRLAGWVAALARRRWRVVLMVIVHCSKGSSSPSVHAGDPLDRVGGGTGGRDEPCVSLVEESGLERFVSRRASGLSHPPVASRRGGSARIFFFGHRVCPFVELICEDAPRLPFILTGVKACSLESLALVGSEVAEN